MEDGGDKLLKRMMCEGEREGWRMGLGGRDEAEAAARLRLQNQHLLCL